MNNEKLVIRSFPFAVWSMDSVGLLGRTGNVLLVEAMEVPPARKHPRLHGQGASQTCQRQTR